MMQSMQKEQLQEMQINHDGKSATSSMQVKFKVQPFSSLKRIPKVNERKLHVSSPKLLNRLIIISQRDMTVKISLKYELTPVPFYLFRNKDQKMNKSNKAGFCNASLKRLTDPLRGSCLAKSDLAPTSPCTEAIHQTGVGLVSNLLSILEDILRN